VTQTVFLSRDWLTSVTQTVFLPQCSVQSQLDDDLKYVIVRIGNIPTAHTISLNNCKTPLVLVMRDRMATINAHQLQSRFESTARIGIDID
jgi:hypothetical protein